MTGSGTGDILNSLQTSGYLADGEIDLAQTALALAALSHPGISMDRYVQHLRLTAEAVGVEHQALLAAGAADDAAARLAALKHIIVDRQGFAGAQEDYDNIENADLMRVIDRRRGMPIALALLYLDAGKRQGWSLYGLNLPGHFILRIDKDGDRVIFDPFNACRMLNAADLRAIIKQHVGPHAELSADYYEPCTNRQILMRLQNNIKLRLIRMEEYQNALHTVEAMRLVDPHEYRLLLDAGVLYARTGQKNPAIEALESYLVHAHNDREREDAALLLQHIRVTM